MTILTRDTSAFKFLTLGGLLSKQKFSNSFSTQVPQHFKEETYLSAVSSFGINEENVRDFVMSLLRAGLGWTTVKKDHDIIATSGASRILVECKRHDSRLLYIDDHRGGSPGETAIEELQRNLKRTGIQWGLLTDGVVFRFIYNADLAGSLFDAYLEFNVHDMVCSTHRWPPEMYWLIDFLSPTSALRLIDPTKVDALPIKDVKRIVKLIRENKGSLFTVIKALAVATMEDMGVRPMHTGKVSIRVAKTKGDYLKIFRSIKSNDPDFHKNSHPISDELCAKIQKMFADLAHVDLSHIDHEFFGIIYQKFINNGNASHYTNTKLSREMALYIASQSSKSQRQGAKPVYLKNTDFILDPALGSGQLLRGLLPFHRVFFRGKSIGIDGWRNLAAHFMGRDIDETAIWIAKINIWLATADKGQPLVALPEFKHLDVIKSTINRAAGLTIRQAFQIDPDKNVAACVSNPPWDAFKNDSRRGITYDPRTVERIKESLNLQVRQLNRAQIFLRIIEKLGAECRNMRFAVILPDSIFVDTNTSVRNSLRPRLDFYFSYPRNFDPETRRRIFEDVDNTRKFGIIFGRSTTTFANLICYPLGKDASVDVTTQLSTIGDCTVYPLFSHAAQAGIIAKWKAGVTRWPVWNTGEFDQSLWQNRSQRIESASGQHCVYGGAAFCDNQSAWSRNPLLTTKIWKRMSSINPADAILGSQGRTLFSDYINNSKKLNSATYVGPNQGINITNTVSYATNTVANDWLIIDSIIYSLLVEAYGTSQHMNSWRLSALGLPRPLIANEPIDANVELCSTLGLSLDEGSLLYDLNASWLKTAINKETWVSKLGQLAASPEELTNMLEVIREAAATNALEEVI